MHVLEVLCWAVAVHVFARMLLHASELVHALDWERLGLLEITHAPKHCAGEFKGAALGFLLRQHVLTPMPRIAVHSLDWERLSLAV